MTWGLVEPSGFGKYFVNGEYIGWDETAEQYFLQMTPKNEVDALRAKGDGAYRHAAIIHTQYKASEKFHKDLGPLHPLEQPREYRLERPPRGAGFFGRSKI